MTDMLRARCDLLLSDRAAIDAAFPWNTGMMHLACAGAYAMRGLTADSAAIKAARQVIRENTGAFSYFRGISEDLLAAMLDISGDPAGLLARAKVIYDALKKTFSSSNYLPLAALTAARLAEPDCADAVCSRAIALYARMKQEHRWLTGADDSAMCVLMALSGRDIDELITRMETVFTRLKGRFAGNDLQALSQVIALMPGRPEELADRVETLLAAFKAAGRRWGKSYELPVLGVLAADPRPVEQIVSEAVDCDNYLKTQKGFGFFSSVSGTHRLMYAALMSLDASDVTEAASVSGVIAAVIAQETAIACVILCSTATSSSSAAHH